MVERIRSLLARFSEDDDTVRRLVAADASFDALCHEYRKVVEGVLPVLDPVNVELVTKIAALPDTIRGYGHVKEANLKKYEQELARLLASFDSVALAKSA